MASDNYIDYPSMTREREPQIQSGLVAKSDDVNAEFNNIVDTYNRLVALLQGEFGGNGRIYEMVDEAIRKAGEASTTASNAVKRTGDTMEGQLLTMLEPSSDYSMVNKKYVDDNINVVIGPVRTLANTNKERLDNLNANQIKLTNGNFVSTNVDEGMSELFHYVSDGKATIAGAITDKGVETSAKDTFIQMATNIRNIPTYSGGGGGGGGEGPDLSLASHLNDDDIAYGKKAYGSNGLITGTHKCSGSIPEYPTYGTDTSDATATAMDILSGKTAYANGVKLTGTLTMPVELLAVDTSVLDDHNVGGFNRPTYKHLMSALSKDGNYIVRVVNEIQEDGTVLDEEIILSNMITNDKIVIQQSAGTETTYTKKYRYTKAELGITGKIVDIAIGPGANGSGNVGTLALVEELEVKDTTMATGTRLKQLLHLIPYHLHDEGHIGNQYATESYKEIIYDLDKHNNQSPDGTYFYTYILASSQSIGAKHKGSVIYMPNKSDKHIYTFMQQIAYKKNDEGKWEYAASYVDKVFHALFNKATEKIEMVATRYDFYVGTNGTVSTAGIPHSVEFSPNDKFISCSRIGYSPTLVPLDDYNIREPIPFRAWAGPITAESILAVDDEAMILCTYSSTISIYSIATSGDGELIFTLLSQIGALEYPAVSSNNLQAARLAYVYANTFMYYPGKPLGAVVESTKPTLLTYNPSNNSISYVKSEYMSEPEDGDSYAIQVGAISTNIICLSGLDAAHRYRFSETGNVIGLKYAGEYYYKIGANTTALDAKAEDVRAGKRFIGASPYPSTGTLEV